MKNYLGIDYGTKHIGLAVADGPLARPLVSIDGAMTDDTMEKIRRIVSDNEVTDIVIGLPEGEMDTVVHAFGERLATMTGVPVTYHPETLSTQEAVGALRASGATRTKLKNDHVYAACLILENYLESISG